MPGHCTGFPRSADGSALTSPDDVPLFRFMLGNLKLALRLLAKSRGFSAVAIITLAVTIGVNSAIFLFIPH